ncbi:MAG TPA: hypothetical protein VI997_07535 [Candidatus Thermoplasmatota archaeon]|nr:hypothetical protein [Candidatus Thermoplasmatota archaeon]
MPSGHELGVEPSIEVPADASQDRLARSLARALVAVVLGGIVLYLVQGRTG